MGTFTSKYRVTDGYGNTSTQTRVDVGKSMDAFATFLTMLTFLAIGIWTSGFLLYLFRTVKNPNNISYKDMQAYGIDTKPILNSKRNGWILLIVTFPIAPISGWIYFFTMRSKLKDVFSLAREFNDSFIFSFYNAIDDKKKIIGVAAGMYGRESKEFVKIAQKEVHDLMQMIEDEFHYPPKTMKILQEKIKELLQLNIPLEYALIGDEAVVYESNDRYSFTPSSFITPHKKHPLSSIKKIRVISKNSLSSFFQGVTTIYFMGLSLVTISLLVLLSWNVENAADILWPSSEWPTVEHLLLISLVVIGIVLLLITRFVKRYKKYVLSLEVDSKEIQILETKKREEIDDAVDKISQILDNVTVEQIEYESKRAHGFVRAVLFVLYSICFGPLYWLYLLSGKKRLHTFILVIVGISGIVAYQYFTGIKPLKEALEEINYAKMNKDSIRQNSQKLDTLIPKSKLYMVYFFHNDAVDTIEEVEALRKKYPYKLQGEDFLRVVNGLGSLDGGYSKKLAEFFNNNMDP
ncbi:hypothetical protein JHD47_08845, partial [Sulfurimonas sp. SAG-AH-194-L11]